MRRVELGGGSDFLCTRCGAVVAAPAPGKDGSYTGSCPECGLGFSGAVMRARTPVRFGFARQREARRAAEAMRRFENDFESVFSRPPFHVYGLGDHWLGRRWPAGVGRSNDIVESIELGHGDPHDDSATEIRVATRWSSDPAPVVYATAAQELVHRIWRHEMPRSKAVRAPFGTADPTDGWDEVDLNVHGAGAAFKLLRHGGEWVAIAALPDGSTVTIETRHAEPEGIRLVRLNDLSAYLDDGAFPWRREPNWPPGTSTATTFEARRSAVRRYSKLKPNLPPRRRRRSSRSGDIGGTRSL